MLGYVARRIMVMVPTLLAISAISFVIIQLPPGDYLSSVLMEIEGRGGDANLALELRARYGLDQPMWVQYIEWLVGLLQGDFGYSFEYNLPVSEVVGDRVILTIILNFATVVFIWVVSFPIAIYSATRQYSWGDYGLTFLGFIGLATPNYLLALVMLYFGNVWFDTSIGGLVDPQYLDQPMSWPKFLSVLEHLIIPVIVIGTSGTAAMIRRLRANLLDELGKQYYVTALAKGLPAWRALLKYPLRMSINPFIADIGNLLPTLISGSSIVAVVLGLPTVGPLLLGALQSQDMYLAGSLLFSLAILTVVGVLLSDLLLAAVDPRIRLGAGAGR